MSLCLSVSVCLSVCLSLSLSLCLSPRFPLVALVACHKEEEEEEEEEIISECVCVRAREKELAWTDRRAPDRGRLRSWRSC